MSKIVCNTYLIKYSTVLLIFLLSSIFAIFTWHCPHSAPLLVRWQWGVGVTSPAEMVRVPPLPVIPHLTQHPGDISQLSQCQSLTSPVSRWGPVNTETCGGVNIKWQRGKTKWFIVEMCVWVKSASDSSANGRGKSDSLGKYCLHSGKTVLFVNVFLSQLLSGRQCFSV